MTDRVTQPAGPPLKATIIPVTPLQQNCSLVWCARTNEAAFVDPGGDLPRLMAAAAEAKVRVTKIILTHGHIDHCGQAGMLAEDLGVPIEGPHEDDRWLIATLAEDAQKYGMEARSFEPDRWLDQGDTVQLGALEFAVHHTPGHTPGHVVFHHVASKLALVGDVLFAGSIGRTDFPRGDHAALVQSVVTRLWPMGDDTTFIPGHGPVSTFARERASNPFVGDRALAQD